MRTRASAADASRSSEHARARVARPRMSMVHSVAPESAAAACPRSSPGTPVKIPMRDRCGAARAASESALSDQHCSTSILRRRGPECAEMTDRTRADVSHTEEHFGTRSRVSMPSARARRSSSALPMISTRCVHPETPSMAAAQQISPSSPESAGSTRCKIEGDRSETPGAVTCRSSDPPREDGSCRTSPPREARCARPVRSGRECGRPRSWAVRWNAASSQP